MAINSNTEEADWRRAWQARSAAAPGVAELRERMVAETRRLKFAMVGPILATLVAGGGTLATALTRRQPADIALAIGVSAFIAVVWVVALWGARGTWQPLAETTDGFLRLSIRRSRSTLAGIYSGLAMYAVGFLGVLWWKYHYLSMSLGDLLTSWQVILFGVVITPVVLFASIFLARRKRAELRALLEVLGQLENETSLP